MRVRAGGWSLTACVVVCGSVIGASSITGWASSSGVGQKAGCVREVLTGEVQAGEGYIHPIGNGLEVMLEPLASGWILRVLPVSGARPAHDYAELTTPPYESVSPLLVSTDFSFRAQDAVAWNPRQFRFAADGRAFQELSARYAEYRRSDTPSVQVQGELANLVSRASEGTLQILDAHLVPGTANQAKTAAMVASHFDTTAHSLEQPADGRATGLGKLTWMRFRVSMNLPEGFHSGQNVTLERHTCP